MSRSLFRRLQRRYGSRVAPHDRDRQLAAHESRFARLLPYRLTTARLPSSPGRSLRVAVIGGGFAGLAAASALQNMGCTVTLFEARANIGGRVESTSSFISHRILERGAELIGRNHLTWIYLARELGLGLSVITTDDEYDGMRLAQPLRIGGRELAESEARNLFASMERAMDDLTSRASVITDDILLEPWQAHNAAGLDRETVGSWIRTRAPNTRLQEALNFEFANNMATATEQQSLLGILAQIAAGGRDLYWTQTEVYRCEDGNASLAYKLILRMEANQPRVTIRLGAQVTAIAQEAGDLRVYSVEGQWLNLRANSMLCDYVVLAVPPSVWRAIEVNGAPLVGPHVQLGPAVKYFAHLSRRFWIANRRAPSAVDTQFGGVWEGTDNQMGTENVDLTVFAGGPCAQAVTGDPEAYFNRGINQLFDGFNRHYVHHRVQESYANWPREPHIMAGYSCPAPGEVTGVIRQMNETPLLGKIFFAGEHVSPGFFGYMEGALQSGIAAAYRIAQASNIRIPLI
ncbi:MAG: NAD(P)/FAD-dependent oxidoreductase [Caldilineaceae bacterium]